VALFWKVCVDGASYIEGQELLTRFDVLFLWLTVYSDCSLSGFISLMLVVRFLGAKKVDEQPLCVCQMGEKEIVLY
jgi:membrane glycosyltransferase